MMMMNGIRSKIFNETNKKFVHEKLKCVREFKNRLLRSLNIRCSLYDDVAPDPYHQKKTKMV